MDEQVYGTLIRHAKGSQQKKVLLIACIQDSAHPDLSACVLLFSCPWQAQSNAARCYRRIGHAPTTGLRLRCTSDVAYLAASFARHVGAAEQCDRQPSHDLLPFLTASSSLSLSTPWTGPPKIAALPEGCAGLLPSMESPTF